jgi:magnesium transporter
MQAVLVLTEVAPDRIAEQRASDEFFWLDLTQPSPAQLQEAGAALGLHPVALEDTLEWRQRPKVDTYGDHLLTVFYTARLTGEQAEPVEVHVYVSGSFVLTVRHQECDVLDQLHAQLSREPIDDEGHLVYRVLDTLTDAWYPVIDALENRIDALEEQVLLHANRDQLEVIYRLRQDVRELGRTVSAQRDHFPATAEAIRSLPGLAHGTRETMRDVADHLAQISSELNRQTEDLAALTSTYFNANADRLNAIVTRLTILGTIFIVWTMIAGFFGQNFGWMVRHIDTPAAFFELGLGLPLVLTAVAGILMWLKRRDLS